MQERGVTDVALVVLTHADLDHLDGLPQLLGERAVRRVIRFPRGDSLPSLLALALTRFPGERRLSALHDALRAIEPFEDQNRSSDAVYSSRSEVLGELTVTPIAVHTTGSARAWRRKVMARVRAPCHHALVTRTPMSRPAAGSGAWPPS